MNLFERLKDKLFIFGFLMVIFSIGLTIFGSFSSQITLKEYLQDKILEKDKIDKYEDVQITKLDEIIVSENKANNKKSDNKTNTQKNKTNNNVVSNNVNKNSNNEKENKKYVVTIVGNGANVSQTTLSCTTTEKSCSVTLPKITRNGFDILGFSENENAIVKTYDQLSKINVSSNMTLYAITNKTVTANFDLNGATNIENKSLSCQIYNKDKSCTVKAPIIYRNGWNIVGFSKDKNAKTGIKPGNSLQITDDSIYYAITKKDVVVSFDSNGAETIEYNSKSCSIYNLNTKCSIRIPIINKKGYVSQGFDEIGNLNADAAYRMNRTYDFTENKTLVANFSTQASFYRYVSSVTSKKYGNVIIELDNSCSNVNKFISYLDEINKNTPYFFKKPGKLMVLSTSKMNQVYPGKGYAGLTYGASDYALVDISCSADYHTVVHELAHKIDREYGLNHNRLSYFDEMINLYDKYKSSSNRPFRDYAYTNYPEFYADSVAYYYEKYILNTYYGNYPDDVKAFVEKSINLFKNS